MKNLVVVVLLFIAVNVVNAQTPKAGVIRSESRAMLMGRDHAAVYKVSSTEYYIVFIKDEINLDDAKREAARDMKRFWKRYKNSSKSRRTNRSILHGDFDFPNIIYSRRKPSNSDLDDILDAN
jgi:hypothetical protein